MNTTQRASTRSHSHANKSLVPRHEPKPQDDQDEPYAVAPPSDTVAPHDDGSTFDDGSTYS